MITLRSYRELTKAECDKALLEAAGIRAFLAGEANAPNYGSVLGELLLQVDEADADRAREVLSESVPLPDNFIPPVPAPETPTETEPPPGGNNITWVIVAILAIAAVIYAGTHHRRQYTGSVRKDRNHDGRTDAWLHYANGLVIKAEYDQNFDGTPDVWSFYREGWIERGEVDANFDGRVDGWWTYRYGVHVSADLDTDYDGVPEVHYVYENGTAAAGDWHEKDGRLFRHETYRHGVRYQELLDEDGDGWFEKRLTYDARNRVVQTESIHERVPPREPTDRLRPSPPARPLGGTTGSRADGAPRP